MRCRCGHDQNIHFGPETACTDAGCTCMGFFRGPGEILKDQLVRKDLGKKAISQIVQNFPQVASFKSSGEVQRYLKSLLGDEGWNGLMSLSLTEVLAELTIIDVIRIMSVMETARG